MTISLRRTPHNIFWSMAAISVMMTSWLISTHGLIGAAAAIALLAGVLVFVYPELLFICSILTIVVGQIIRLPIFGAENSIIFNDIIIPLLIVAWLLQKLASRRWQLPRQNLSVPLWTWLTVAAISLMVNAWLYSRNEML